MSFFQEQPELLEPFRRGDPKVIELVYTEYQDRLLRYLAQHGFMERFDMMDVLAETFFRAFSPRQLAAYDPRSQFFSYLVGIARNVMISHRRKQQRLILSDDEDAPDQGNLASRAEAGQLLNQIFDQLDDQERTAVLMTLEEGRTQESAARRMGIDRNMVKRAVMKARRILVKLAYQKASSGGRS